MDFLIEILSLGTYSVFGLILLFVCIYYMLIDDEEEELGLLSEKKKARLDEIVKKYKQLSD